MAYTGVWSGWGPIPAAAVRHRLMPAAPVWHVRIYERDSNANVLGYLGEAVPTPAGGGGGYENVEMPKRGPITVWRNHGASLTFSFEIIFSKFLTEESVMDDVTTLWRMYSTAQYETKAPVVKFNAAGKLLPFEAAQWWINDLEWGDAEANNDGERTLQRMTVHLTEYAEDVRLTRTRRHQWPASVRVKKGQTLKSIAHHYKVPGGWRAIGRIQNPPIRDPKRVKAGQKIRMP